MSSKKIVAIIPARMGSSRFPGKPLIKILGLEMIEHVRRRVQMISGLHQVVVATCDDEIKTIVENNGGKVIMTSSKHERATDRIEEASQKIEGDIFINVQGDEPMVSQTAIEEVIAPFQKNSAVECSCLVYPINDLTELTNDNVVKVVLSQSNRILYLSRQSIPGRAVNPKFQYYKQSGIMAFTRKRLHEFTKLNPTPLEAKESIDLLRLLEHDRWVQAVVSNEETRGVDVPEQVKQVEDAILSDSKQKKIFEQISN